MATAAGGNNSAIKISRMTAIMVERKVKTALAMDMEEA
jgi:hypothetical protein